MTADAARAPRPPRRPLRPSASRSARLARAALCAVAAFAAPLLTACGGGQPAPDTQGARSADRQAKQLDALGEEFWTEQMRHSPLWATSLGDHRRDDELGRASPAERDRHLTALRNLSGRLSALNRRELDADRQVTAELLDFELRTLVGADEACQADLWTVDQLAGPQVAFAELSNSHLVTSKKAGDDLVARYRQVDEYFKDVADNLRDGLRRGLVAPKSNVERTLRQLDDMLAVPPAQSAFVAPVLAGLAGEHPVPALGKPYQERLLAVVEQSVYGGLRAYRDFLKAEILPKAREAVGVGALPIGARCYAAAIEANTGLTLDAEALFALGTSEIARIEKSMAALVSAAGGGDFRAYLKALPERKDQYAPDAAALLDHNRELMARAMRALPRAFGHLPTTIIEVKPIEAFREKDAPAAYYYQAPDDGSRPAWYYVNTFRPDTRVLNKMPALAFHEAVPGHHLQIALANENKALPMFQRQMGLTAFVEGWALYAEGLADELGLYRTADEKLGQLSFEMWRAARLVVDTGLHAKGWTRQQAIDFMVEKTGIRVEEIRNEVDRYIVWPGQALAYKVGELEIRKLRAFAEQKLGPRFDLRAFHDHLLGHGAVTLPAARHLIEAWVAEAGR